MKSKVVGAAVLLLLNLATGASGASKVRLDPRFTDISHDARHKCCLGPAFVTLKDGRVLTVYHAPLTYDSPKGATWIACRVTRDEGKTWTPERKIVQHPECQASHPTMLRTRDGVVRVFYLGYQKHSWTRGEPNSDDVSDLWTVASLDEGKTWVDRKRIFKGYTGATNGAIQTRSGSIVVPFSHYVSKPGRLVSVTAVSADNGKTWKLSNRIDIGGKGDHAGAVEPAVVELKNGKLWMLIRTEKGRFWESFSADNGLTWSKAIATRIDASHAPCHITRLASGRLALVWNRQKVGRGELSLAFSADDGKTWSEPVVFARGKQVCYPFVAESTPGMIWIGFLDVERGWNDVQTRLVRIAEVDLTLPPKLRQRCLEVLRQALRSTEFWPSIHAAEALTQAGRGEEVRAALKDRLKTERDDRKRCGLARELVRAGDGTRLAILLDVLVKSDLDGRIHAAESFYKIGDVGDGRLLRRVLAGKEKGSLRLMAAAALARCGNQQALAVVRKHLAGDNADDRMIAAYILGRLGDRTDLPGLRRSVRHEKDPLKWSFAQNALACLGDPAGLEVLARNLGAAEAAVRSYAAEAAGPARAFALIPKLTGLLDDRGVDVRVHAAQSLLALAQPAPAADKEIVRDVYPATKRHPRYSEGSVVALPDGTLLYATTEFSGGADDFDRARIIARASGDGGRTWGPARVLQKNIGKKNVMEATLLWLAQPVRQDTSLGLFYLVTNSFDDLKVYLRISRDQGRTFGSPILVTRQPGYHVMNNDRVALLSTGRLVCPVSYTRDYAKNGHFVAVCWVSDDGGKTWKAGDKVDLPKRGAMEPEVLELSDGRLLMLLRTQLGHIAVCYSRDGGKSWGKPASWNVKAPEAPATLRRIPATGDLLLVWNHTYQPNAGHGGKRTPLTAAISADEGRTWKHLRNLEDRTDQTYAYTSLIFFRERALLTYYVEDVKTGRLSSRFRSLPVRWFYKGER